VRNSSEPTPSSFPRPREPWTSTRADHLSAIGAVLLATSGQFRDRHWAGSHGRRQSLVAARDIP
jgi:hypothetical protein